MTDKFGIRDTFQFFSSGSTLIDLVLGGGFPLGRISNLVGDAGVGKSLCAIEASANFAKAFPTGVIHYIETEAAFDENYAEAVGCPMDRVELHRDVVTVQELRDFLNKELDSREKDYPALYIVDSLDALNDETSMTRFEEDKSEMSAKAKFLASFFQYFTTKFQQSSTHLMILSQVRDNIGGGLYSPKFRRSGGKALDHNVSQIIWLHPGEKIEDDVKNSKVRVGNWIIVKNTKNRIGKPFRTCEVPLIYGYGIDNLTANLYYLHSNIPKFHYEGISDKNYYSDIKKLMRSGNPKDHEFLRRADAEVADQVKKLWNEIEEEVSVNFKKYT